MGNTARTGFIGGGRMAEALIKGIIKSGLAQPENIVAADPDPQRRQHLTNSCGIAAVVSGAEVLTATDVVVLAVKPQVVAPVLESLREGFAARHLLVSIAAGIATSYLATRLQGSGCRIVRVMPNTPALVLEGASAICAGPGASAEDMETVRRLFNAVGSAVVVDEGLMDAVTGLSGSGPAYVLTFLEAMIDAGVKVGLPRETAALLAARTISGSVRLALETGAHPAELKAMVTSPGGTTIAGLHVLERGGFRGMVMDAVEAATTRSKELGA